MAGPKSIPTRRSLLEMGLRFATAGAAAGCLRPAFGAAGKGSAQAVVCIYLHGGNDSNNMLVPLEQEAYDSYCSSRGALALPLRDLLHVDCADGGPPFALHPALTELRRLFDRGVVAFVAGVGPAGGSAPTHMDTGLSYLRGGFVAPGWAASVAASGATFTFSSGLSVVCSSSPVLEGPQLDNPTLCQAVEDATQGAIFPKTGLSRQLRQAAGLIQAGPGLGMGRQVMLCSLGGFDTHYRQLSRQALLLRDLSRSTAAFYNAMADVGLDGAVTVYTDSEFGRSLLPNASGGTNHGWGAHHVVLGGAVLGGRIFGRFPGIAEADGNGVFLPSVTREEYEGTLANWIGVGTAYPSEGSTSLGFFG
jgi:uncharacterized protein (DUF1501 family)